MFKKIILLTISLLSASSISFAVKGKEAKAAKAAAQKAEKQYNKLQLKVTAAERKLEAIMAAWSKDIQNVTLQGKVRQARARLETAKNALNEAKPTLEAAQAPEMERKQKVVIATQKAQEVKTLEEQMRKVTAPEEPVQVEPEITTEEPIVPTTNTSSITKNIGNFLLCSGLAGSAYLIAPKIYAADKVALTQYNKRLSLRHLKSVVKLFKEDIKAQSKAKKTALGLALASLVSGIGIRAFGAQK
jgi:hypothetical protein